VNRKLFQLVYAVAVIAASSVIALSQTGSSANAESASTPQAVSESQTRKSADETFELNITERRITERGFTASTAVEIGEETARGLLLRVGVDVGADEINVLLRNVRGHVRFRATLDRVLERLNSRPAPSAVP
jgi:hypothetical protein